MTATPTEVLRAKVRQDVSAIRETLKRIKDNESLAALNLFSRHEPDRMLEYLDRRSCARSPVQMPVYITCVAFDGEYIEALPDADDVLVVTRDVSLRGLGFTHDEPLLAGFAKVTFDLIDDESVSLLLHVQWTKEQQHPPHMSGGRFVGIVDLTE